MSDWTQCVRETVAAMGSLCCEVPDEFGGNVLAVMSVHPIFVRLTPNGDFLSIEATLLPVMHGSDKDDPPRQQLLEIAVQIAASICTDTVCDMDAENDNILVTVRLPLAGGVPDETSLAQSIGHLSETQKTFDDFLSGEMNEEDVDAIMRGNWVGQLMAGRDIQGILAESEQMADEIERILSDIK